VETRKECHCLVSKCSICCIICTTDLTTYFVVGLALQEQLLEAGEIPTDASDWRLDALIVGDGSLIRGCEGSE